MESVVEFVVAGLGANAVGYLDALELQRTVHAAVVAGSAPDTVILLEHPSVYTAGKRTEDFERPSDGTPVIDVDRGGKITWHGPGQLVGYPITTLTEPVDVVGYVRQLETVIIEVLAELGISAGRVSGRSGVWIGHESPSGAEKIAAIGIRVASGVTMHGFSLNCNNSFEAYSKIVACGILDAGVTSISRELGREISPTDVAPLIQRHLELALNGQTLGERAKSGAPA
jgi:lipoyl(octanoyl) transferase